MKHTFYLSALLIIAILSSCKHTTPLEKPYIGEAICAGNNFLFTNAPDLSSDNIDLDASSLNITASMNESVPWTIRIEQSSTGAYKTFSGRSSHINIEWKGEPESEDVFFSTGACTVTITPACKDPEVLSFTISNTNSFSDYGTPVVIGGTGFYAGTSVTTSANPSPQGGNSQVTSGTSGWWIGGFGWNPFSIASGTASSGINDPEKIYMNFYLRAESGTAVTITFKDADNAEYKKTLIPDENGWVMISKPLSFWNVYDPSTLKLLEIGGGPTVENEYAEFAVDFIVFTYGEPFFTSN